MDVWTHVGSILRRVTGILPAVTVIYISNVVLLLYMIKGNDSVDKEFRDDFFVYFKLLTIACVALLFVVVFNRILSSRQLSRRMPYIKSAEEFQIMAKSMKESDEIT